MSAPKSLPLTKDEVMQLVQLVKAAPIIFSKVTNASNNQLKEAAWKKITNSFNALIASTPRRPEQLRLKWENLKKAARKRSTTIRMNNLKTGGGKPEYIPPDDALDQVASILGPTCDGYSVQFGGDAIDTEDVVVEQLVAEPAVVINVPFEDTPFDVDDITLTNTSALSPHTPQPKKFFFSSVKSKEKLKHQTSADDVKASIVNRNRSMAEYYDAKRKNEEIMLALKKRKMELEILAMEKYVPTNDKIGNDNDF